MATRLFGARGAERPRKKSALVWVAGLIVAGCLGVGCPQTPVLQASPGALDFGTSATRVSFTIYNEGAGNLTWELAEVAWDAANHVWVKQSIPWLTIDPTTVDGVTGKESDRIFLNASRTGLAPGTYTGAGIQIASNGGTTTIPISLVVPSSGGTGGTGELQLAPLSVALSGASDVETFSVSNVGTAAVHWYATVTVNAPNATASTPVQVSASPADAVTNPGASTTVTVGVPDPSTFDTNFLNYTVTIKDKTTNAIYGTVSVSVEQTNPPAIGVDPATLDFGKDGYQLSFAVANTGDPYSLLTFAVFSKNTDGTYSPFDIDADALIASITMPQGSNDIHGDADDPFLFAKQVVVTISRDGIENDLEYRDLWIGAVQGVDSLGNPVLNAAIAPVKVQVRVEASPYVEGAINRSRPPSLMRFVFLLRDKRGQAVNAADEVVRNQISFFIKEDGFALDPDESSQFVMGPESLRTNIVLLLDYTGSMYNAGVASVTNPMQKGEAIAQMVAAARQFILDVPDSYRIALMEYHDRHQTSRMIHGFDTNKAALVASLDAFSMPASEHGASEIYDALVDACNTLVRQDAGQTLPFDEADVRSVVFVSDGWDTSSLTTVNDLTKLAKDNRVRLYPLGYSGSLTNPLNEPVLLNLAAETGGHSYYAPEIGDLATLLDTEQQLSFGTTLTDLASGTATIQIRNLGTSTVTWNAISGLPWLVVDPPSGVVPPLHRLENGQIDEPGVRNVTVALSAGLAAGDYAGTFQIASAQGSGTVQVSAHVVAGQGVRSLQVLPHSDDAGRLWRELSGQVVLSYTSLFQGGTNHTYQIEANYPDSHGDPTSASFEEDAVFYGGDPRAGQLSLTTSGIQDGKAEVFVRTDYVPRGITQFRLRFIPSVPEVLTPNLTAAERAALLTRLQTVVNSITADSLVPAPAGLLGGWRLIPEGQGIVTIVTEPSEYLTYGAFGDLMKLTFDNLGPNDAFTLDFRVDNTLYYSPAMPGSPSMTKYFLYPNSYANPGALLTVASGPALAAPSRSIADFLVSIDPEAAGIWDRDGDGTLDFDDAAPDNRAIQ